MNTFGIRRLLNNKNHQSRKLLPFLLLLIMPNAFAGFDVQNPDYQQDYGNAQNETFRRAVEYEESLDSSDRSFLASVQEQEITNRWYWKAQIGRPKVRLKSVRNDSTGAVGSPAVTNDDDRKFHFLLGYGYKWTRWATELELLIGESFTYRTNPILTGQNLQLKADIKNYALFLNFEYEIPTYFDFITRKLHPYANAGVGLAMKTSDSQTLSLGGQPSNSETKNNIGLAYQFSLGAKYQVTGSLLLDVAYRWMRLGEVKFGPVDGFALKASGFNTSGFYLGITYER